MNTRKVLIAGIALAIAAFLLGFVPQYMRGRDLENRLASTSNDFRNERARRQFDELALRIGEVYLQTTVKNYGFAGQHASKFFDGVRALHSENSDPKRQNFINFALSKRDSVIGGLAKGDPSIATEVQELFRSALDVTEVTGK